MSIGHANIIRIYNERVRNIFIMHGLAGVVVGTLRRFEIAFQTYFVFVHSVLKWLHHPLLKYVILLHSESS